MPASNHIVLERDFQAAVVKAADLLGWLSYHTHDSRRSRHGFPDLVLARGTRIVYSELKRVGQKPAPAQREWLDTIAAAGGEAYLWTLDDWNEITVILSGGPSFRASLGRAGSAWIPYQGRRDGNTPSEPSQRVREAA